MQQQQQNVIISGAGLVGSLLAIYMGQQNFKVDIYERRPDMRKKNTGGGRSINLALSDRGWRALAAAGIAEELKPIAIPMSGRMIHKMDGSSVFQPYGKEGQAIYSISRGELNRILMDKAEAHPNVNITFHTKCRRVDVKGDATVQMVNKQGEISSHTPDLMIGADGAFSSVRSSMQRASRFNYSQHYLPHGYKELHIPPSANGGFRIEKNALHIWPRKNFMLIALPNIDGSFTCTLFLAFEGDPSFDCLQTTADLMQFFETYFPSAIPHMPTLKEDFFNNPTSSLVTIRCNPWTYGRKVALIGDASHAIVPFYGQGMNSGFEDCRVFNDIMNKYRLGSVFNWQAILEEYEAQRIPDADAIADLALRNFVEMRDLVADPQFLLRKKIAQYLHTKYPEQIIPLYSMVTFSHIRYSEALRLGKLQDAMFEKIMAIEQLEQKWDTGELDAQFEVLVQNYAAQAVALPKVS